MSELPPIEPPHLPPPAGGSSQTGLPWEEPSAGLGSIFATARRILASPSEAYNAMSTTVDLVRPIAYFVAWVLIGTLFSQLWNFLLFDSYMELIRSLAGPQLDRFAPLLHRPGALQLVFGLIVAPLIALIALFIWAGLVHVTLSLLGGANRGFAGTLRVMCYSETTQVATLIPGIGGLIGFVWRVILDVVGLSIVHKTEGWKALLAVLLPLLVCCVCLIAGALAAGAALGQALQNLK